MRDSELTERPGKGWTPWAKGPCDHDIEKVWWAAPVVHFPKLNVSTWFDGSQVVGIWHWGFRQEKWTMKLKPADWQPLPEVYRLAREAEKQCELDLFRERVQKRCLEATARLRRRKGPYTVWTAAACLAPCLVHDRNQPFRRSLNYAG